MKARKGYLMIEVAISVCIILLIVSILYGLLFFGLNIYKKLHSSIEIQQQGIEIQNHIENELKNGIEIISVKTKDNQIITSKEFDYTSVISIKYKPINREDNVGFDELFLNKKTSKIFIKRRNASSGHEIGDYLDNIYISKANGGNIINIKLELSKNIQSYFIEFTLYNNQKNMGEVI
ncbi:MAG: hypothetical protein RR835_01960 [Peptostreptococcaceae bacterium]